MNKYYIRIRSANIVYVLCVVVARICSTIMLQTRNIIAKQIAWYEYSDIANSVMDMNEN